MRLTSSRRTRETHTKWHPDQSVVAADEATPNLPSIDIDAADNRIEGSRSPSVSVDDTTIDMSETIQFDGHWPTSSIGASPQKEILLFIHDQVYNVSSFLSDHP
jgi:cytochrome b involved in lipid metabolism